MRDSLRPGAVWHMNCTKDRGVPYRDTNTNTTPGLIVPVGTPITWTYNVQDQGTLTTGIEAV